MMLESGAKPSPSVIGINLARRWRAAIRMKHTSGVIETMMTQNDQDKGHMICLVGIAPIKPAEFVIFRIGQWIGDAKV